MLFKNVWRNLEDIDLISDMESIAKVVSVTPSVVTDGVQCDNALQQTAQRNPEEIQRGTSLKYIKTGSSSEKSF